MGHNICAIIGKEPINRGNLKKYQLAAAFEKGYAIIFLEFDSILWWSAKLSKSSVSDSEKIGFGCEISHFFAQELALELYCIIQTDYFAGVGDQAASVYKKGTILDFEVSINEALRKIGVEADGPQDAFGFLNLPEYRNSEFYYWEEGNWADGKENMIGGRIPSFKNL